MSIIERILQIMDSKHLNQTELCKILGIKDSTFSSWKTRGTDPPAKYLVLICEFLGVSVDYLLGRTEEPQRIQINSSNVVNGDNGNNSPLTVKNNQDEMSIELLKKFNELSFDEKIEVFNYIKSRKA